MQYWCDIGVNLFSEQFAADRQAVLQRATEQGVRQLLLISSDLAETRLNIHFCHGLPHYRVTAGVHPHQANNVPSDWLSQLTTLVTLPGVAAVGECGLDFNRDFSPRPVQQQVFSEQLQLARQQQLPVYLHERDAFDTQLAILREQAISNGVVHCFTGDKLQVAAYLDLGLHIGITGWLCDERRGQALQEAIRYIPDDRLLLETDAPYLLPRTLTDKPKSRRNEPAFLPVVAAEVARIKQLSMAKLAMICQQNSQRLLGFGVLA